jgi:hypothetical protein
MVNSWLRDSRPNGLKIARIAEDEALNPGLNKRLIQEIPKSSESMRKALCTAN